MNKRKVAIVGGAGFIGSHLTRHLSRSFGIRVLDKKSVPKDVERQVEFYPCDIRDYSEVEKGLKGMDLVIHTAVIQLPTINERKRLGYEVNVLGTQNLCEAVNRLASVKGLILAGTWHVFGESGLHGTIDEGFGFRPDKIEDRARLYALNKMTQETIVRIYDEFSEKIYAIIRLGTVLGEGMPEKTAANLFISNGLKGENITPYEHSMDRPMLYVDINDVCRAFKALASKILNNNVAEKGNSLNQIINLFWPEPITILKLANIIKDSITRCSQGKITPGIKIIDAGRPSLYTREDCELIKVDIEKMQNSLNIRTLTSPEKSVERIVKRKLTEVLKW